MNTLIVKSDVKNRLRKVREGIVYNDMFAVVDELIQNSHRAKAKNVEITLHRDTFSMYDDGIGCKDPDVLFTLDHSGFGNGFGEGFTSIYTLADEFRIHTKDWEGYLNIDHAMQDEYTELSVEITKKSETLNGFRLELKGKKISEYEDDLRGYIEKAASLIPSMDFVLNGESIRKTSLFNVDVKSDFVRRFNNRKYEGMLSLVDDQSDSYIKVYNEYRYVEDFYFYGLSGSILLYPNAVNLRTPDRRSIIYDHKRVQLQNQFEKDIKSLIKEMIKIGNGEDIEKYSDVVDCYMNVEEYISYLTINSNEILNQYEVRSLQEDVPLEMPMELTTESVDAESDEEEQGEQEKNLQDEVPFDSVEREPIKDAAVMEIPVGEENQPLGQEKTDMELVLRSPKENITWDSKMDTKRTREDKEMTAYVRSSEDETFVNKSEMKNVSIFNIKQKKNVVWVRREEVEDYKSLMDSYEYYGVYTFVSPHILYDNSLYHLGIPHISMVEDEGIRRDYKVTKIGSRSKKEERAMELLGMIEKEFGLSETFYLSTIECKMIVKLRGTRIYQEQLSIDGYAQGDEIHLNRKSLYFGKLSGSQLGNKTLGIHDVKFILGNLDTIAHELAHRIYDTKDNTKYHLEKQTEIQDRIAAFVVNY